MQEIDDCKEIHLALTRAEIATRPEKCLQTFRLVVTAQYTYQNIFESSHEEVLCVAKDETSVDIMCRKLCCNFLRKSRL
jgi:hypothetical protein